MNFDEEIEKKFTKKLSRDILSYLSGKSVPALLSIASVAIFTRIFQPNEYGVYSIVMVIVTILSIFLSKWMEQSTLRFFPEYDKKKALGVFYKTLFILLFITSCIFAIVSVGAFPLFRRHLCEYEKFYFVSLAIIIISIFFNNFHKIFQANLQSESYAKYEILGSILRFSFSLCFILLIARNIIGLVIAMLFSYTVLIYPLIHNTGSVQEVKRSKVSFDKTLGRSYIYYGFPMVGWFLSAQLLNLSDRFFIGYFKGSTQVGIYSSNYGLVDRGAGLIFLSMLLAVHPMVMNLWAQGDKTQVQRLMTVILRYFFLISIPIFVFVSIFSRDIATLFLGESFRDGYVIIPIVLLGFIFWYLSMFVHKWLELLKKTQLMFVYIAGCAMINAILNLFFVKTYGYIGAAITTLISFFLYLILVYNKSKSFIIIPWKSFLKIGSASVIVGAYLLIFRLFLLKYHSILLLILLALSSFPFYFWLLYMFKELKNHEIKFLKKVLILRW